MPMNRTRADRAADPGEHPRHELEKAADGLAEVANAADYFGGQSGPITKGFDPAALLDALPKPDREALESLVLRNWEALARLAKTETPVHPEGG